MSRQLSLVILPICFSLSGCFGPQQVSDMNEVAGCFKSESGKPMVEIRADGSVLLPGGSPISQATLEKRQSTSHLKFTPGIVLSADRGAFMPSETGGGRHMVLRAFDQTHLTLSPPEEGSFIRQEGGC